VTETRKRELIRGGLMTYDEVCTMTRLGLSTIKKLVLRGEIFSIKVAGEPNGRRQRARRLIPKLAVEEYLSKHLVGA
jgi:excisionase family DNA binding protein